MLNRLEPCLEPVSEALVGVGRKVRVVAAAVAGILRVACSLAASRKPDAATSNPRFTKPAADIAVCFGRNGRTGSTVLPQMGALLPSVSVRKVAKATTSYIPVQKLAGRIARVCAL